MSTAKIAILGTGNIGRALALGLVGAGSVPAAEIVLTRRHLPNLEPFREHGFQVQTDNVDAVKRADTVVLAVQPQQLDLLLDQITPVFDPARHTLISVVSGASCASIRRDIDGLAVVRAMPNVAIAIGQSMTCLAGDDGALDRARAIFDAVGTTVVIDEELMIPATALCACGVAFFLRAIRAASQGGIEIGFHPEESLAMAAQTALGAAALMLEMGTQESEIDTVTTPRGCTIAGLNELEHRGFSSALIKGILTATEKAGTLYAADA
ncbi:MAG: pyrroline-5-carboxylate reductase family protein [Planctomycetota bacterium]|jgi:pyrroline-5-carboxylate reductase